MVGGNTHACICCEDSELHQVLALAPLYWRGWGHEEVFGHVPVAHAGAWRVRG